MSTNGYWLMYVPDALVGRVDRALQREGLDVSQHAARVVTAIEGQAPADVPRVIAYDGPAFPRVGDRAVITIQTRRRA